MATFTLPPRLDANEPRLAHTFSLWRKELDVYMLASGASEKAAAVRRAIILHAASPDFIELAEHFQYENDSDKTDPDALLAKLAEHCTKDQNEVVETFRFWKSPLCTPFTAFLNNLIRQAKSCNFGTHQDRMIRDKIVFTVGERLQQALLRETKLDLKTTIQICQAYEMSERNAAELQQGTDHFVQKLSIKGSGQDVHRRASTPTKAAQECQYCGRQHRS